MNLCWDVLETKIQALAVYPLVLLEILKIFIVHYNLNQFSLSKTVVREKFRYRIVGWENFALNFAAVEEILICGHSNKSYWAVFSCGAGYYAVQGGSNFWVRGWNPEVWPFNWKLLRTVLSCGAGVRYLFPFWVREWNSEVWSFKW